MSKMTFHLLSNAHLDPVWLWDWREGLNEAATTTNCMLDLMDSRKDLTFIRGEAALYNYIEDFHPKTFKRMLKRIEEGRWDVVGGTWIQPDTNLPATETFCRHFTIAQNYFMSRFGFKPRAAWATDSFGHSAGLPEILEAAGMEYFAFSRPNNTIVPLEKPAFWWRGQGGAKILSYRATGGYCCDRPTLVRNLDNYLAESKKWGGLENIAVFYGLGDHGGGTTRGHLAEIDAWAKAHPEIKVIHSTLHGYFAALRKELDRKGDGFLPEHKGELNFTLRGCYSSAAKLKFKYRQLEADLCKAETVDTAVSSLLKSKPACLDEAWKATLFNSFHDILPGSSIERAYDDQLAWIGGALHTCNQTLFTAINKLAKEIDTSVEIPKGDLPSGVPMLVFNPHPFEYNGPVEMEASMDYRPVWEYRDKKLPWEVLDAKGSPITFQELTPESDICHGVPWRKRALANVKLPPLGWSLFELRWREGAVNPKARGPIASAPKKGVIQNGLFKVEARKGAKGIRISKNGQQLFQGKGFSVATFEDPFSSWGDIHGEKGARDVNKVRENWRIEQVKTLENGPLRATLWVRMSGGSSWMELTISLLPGEEKVNFSARMLLNERAARVKLLMPSADGNAEYQVPGGTIVRKNVKGEVPGGRWVKVSAKIPYGFASDALYNFDVRKGLFRATVARTSHYASEGVYQADEVPEMPSTDSGEYRFKFLIGPSDESIERMASCLEMQPFVQTATPIKGGRLERTGSILKIEGTAFKLLALKPAEDGNGMIARVQELCGKNSELKVQLPGGKISLGKVRPFKIATFRLAGAKTGRTDGIS